MMFIFIRLVLNPHNQHEDLTRMLSAATNKAPEGGEERQPPPPLQQQQPVSLLSRRRRNSHDPSSLLPLVLLTHSTENTTTTSSQSLGGGGGRRRGGGGLSSVQLDDDNDDNDSIEQERSNRQRMQSLVQQRIAKYRQQLQNPKSLASLFGVLGRSNNNHVGRSTSEGSISRGRGGGGGNATPVNNPWSSSHNNNNRKQLNLSGLQISTLEESAVEEMIACHVEKLNLSQNETMVIVPETLVQGNKPTLLFSTLKQLDLSKCQIVLLPDLWDLPNLQTLDLSMNRLRDFPSKVSVHIVVEVEKRTIITSQRNLFFKFLCPVGSQRNSAFT